MQDDPLIGTLLGHFKVERVIAVGGMGVIYQATHSVIGRTAAIKVLSEKYSSDKNMIKRLHREARAVNQIGHPNIVDIFDFGQTPDRREYFVMEYLPGISLAQMMERRGRLPWALVNPIMTQMLDALAAAHDQGIVHRDMKPENILVSETEDGVLVKVLDFGIAKSVGLGPEGERLTRAGVVLGTPEYIAPEQIRGKQVDGRADLYAAGVMLFEMVMGHRPYDSSTVINLLMSHLKEPVPRMDDIPPELGIPDYVPAVVSRAMAKKPEERFPDARTFARALGIATTAVAPADGTRPLPQMMWEKSEAGWDDAGASIGTQRTVPGLGPPLPGSPATAPLPARGATLPGAGPPEVVQGRLVQVTAPGPAIPTGAVPEQRRSPLVWIVPLALVVLAGVAVGLYFALREGAKPVVVAKPDAAPDAAAAPAEIDIQALYERVRWVVRAGSTNTSPEVRQICVRGVGRLGEKDALALVSASLREDPEQSVRAAAAIAIADLGDPAGVQALREARGRSDDAMKVWIDEALMRLGHHDGQIGLREALRSKDKEARFQAALALGEAKDKTAIPALTEVARQAAILNPSTFIAVLGTLAQMGHQQSFAALEKALAQGAAKKKENRVLKLGAAEAMAKLGSDKAVATLKATLKERDPTSQLVAAKILASLGDYSGLDQLAEGIAAKDDKIRKLAAEGLGSVADKAALPALAKGLEDPKWPVKAASAESLAKILALMPSALVRRSQDWIKTALAARDWSVRHAAVGVTADMDPELALSLLGWAFQDKDPRVRAAAVASLGKLRNKKALPLLKRALVDPAEEVRAEAARALAAVGGQEESEALHATVRDQSPTVGISAAGALLAMGETTYVKDLQRAAKSRNPKLRRAAITALGKWNDPKALALLKGALKDKSPEVRLAAALELSKRGDGTGQAELRKAVQRDDPEAEQALAALTKLGVKPTAEIQALAKSPRPEARRKAMASAHLLPPAAALRLLNEGARDPDAGVRLAAAGALTKAAPKHAGTIPALQRLAKDADPVVRARASIGLAKARAAHSELSAMDKGSVKPVKEAPLPEMPKIKPKPPPPKGKERPLFVDVNSPEELFKYNVGRAMVASSSGNYVAALNYLRRAQRHKKAGSVQCDFGETYFKLALSQIRKNKTDAAIKHLGTARQHYRQCGARARGKLKTRAKAGLADVARMMSRIR